MIETTTTDIKQKALSYQENNQNWHFHVLLPGCIFNDQKTKLAFILEGPEGIFVNYSDEMHSDLGKELAPLAHNTSLFEDDTKPPSESLDEQSKEMIRRAEKLNKEQCKWHHHVTSHEKQCTFHSGNPGFDLVFEDPEKDKPIVLNFDHEPKEVLKYVEPLFYSQK